MLTLVETDRGRTWRARNGGTTMVVASSAGATEAPRLDAIDGRLALTVVALTAVATTSMLEATRVFLSYTVFVVDQSERVKLAAIAIAIFLAYGLAAVIVKLLGVRSAIVVSVGVLIGARLALQFWDDPGARSVLGATATVGWGWLLVAVVGVARDPAALGVGIGLVADLAIRIAFLTVDLPWMPDAARDVASLVLAAAAVLSLVALVRIDLPGATEPNGRAAASLLAIGPALAAYHLAVGNLGFLVVKSDDELAIVGLWVLFGAFAALGEARRLQSPGVSPRREVLEWIAIAAATLVFLWLLWSETGPAIVWVVVPIAGTIALLLRALGSGGAAPRRDGVTLTAVWITVGMLLYAGLVFAYFTFTGHPVPLAVAMLLLIGGAWLSGLTGPSMAPWPFPRMRFAEVVAPIIVVLVTGAAFLQTADVDAGVALDREITVMTYNIQLGFSRDNRWSLEQTARTIEAHDPDIVVLQEVSRGWVIAGGVDQAQWLSQRLAMPIVFGAASRDGLWGNAVLTRAPIASEAVTIFTSTQNLRRGVVALQLATDAGDLWVFGTHLDNPEEAGEIRLEQVDEFLTVWDGRTPAIFAGDLNATPDSEVVATLIQAGFVDTGASLGPDAFTSENGRRIDYVMVAGPIATREVRIPDVWTSDHKPVVAELTLGT
jgi:endonuclease/exonuclease/phosphatase family metal-dependent hydrolase